MRFVDVRTELKKRDTFSSIRKEIIACRRCPRLVAFREKIAREKTKRYVDWEYWGKPVPGFGDTKASLVLVGLAPAPHGGNRTGRVFTGDLSAKFLIDCLYAAGFANQPISESRKDGLKLIDAYMLAAVRCVPPDNIPEKEEFNNCYPFFSREMRLLTHKKAILALGKIAFDACIRYAREQGLDTRGMTFRHGAIYRMENFPLLCASYHPSPRNTNTGTLTRKMFLDMLTKIRKEADIH
ncbi:MAG: uracil-DNA glycosylase [Methanomassiliicoccales archaeon]